MIQTGVHVHLDNTIVNGSLDFLLRRARATMEDEEARKNIAFRKYECILALDTHSGCSFFPPILLLAYA